jgi:hypothetical protein
MWFLNRREVYHGFSLKEQAEVRSILKVNQVKYNYRIINFGSKTRGNLGLNKKYELEYYIYVHKKDYDNALHLLGRQRSSG